MLKFYKKNKNTFKIIGICLLLICIHFALTRFGDHISYMYTHERGFAHSNLAETFINIFILSYLGILSIVVCGLLWIIWKYITNPIFCKKNTLKIVGICLVVICIGVSITKFGDHMSYMDAQGLVHDNILMLGGLLLSIAGCIGILFTAFGYLLWGIWKCVTIYVCRRK